MFMLFSISIHIFLFSCYVMLYNFFFYYFILFSYSIFYFILMLSYSMLGSILFYSFYSYAFAPFAVDDAVTTWTQMSATNE